MSDGLGLGSIIAGCRLESIAGQGGMGIVFRATQLALDRPVALKAMAPELAEDGEYRQRFQRESHVAASIDHPNVIPVYEAGELEGTLYLIMRWVDGIDLRALLDSSGRLPPARALRILRPVTSALAAAHRRGLVHRDVKPANVLISQSDDESEHVYLTDFGIARLTGGESAMTRTGVFVGSIDYMAPERIEGGKGDGASDIYSLGCMLYEALTGRLPFDRPTALAKLVAHVHDPIPSVRTEVGELPEQLDAIVAKTMAKRPADRFRSAGELASALGRALEEVETTKLGRPEPTQPATPREAPTEVAPGETEVAPGETEIATRERTTLPGAPRRPPPAPPSDRRRARALLAAGLGGLLVVVGVVVALIAGGGGGTNPVQSINGDGMTEGQTIDLGGTPGGLSVGASGNMWASLPDRGVVVRINPDTGRTTTFQVGGRPTAIAVGARGVWVADSVDWLIALLSDVTGAPRATSVLGSAPTAVAVDPNDGSAWVADSSGAINHVGFDGGIVGTPAQISPAASGIGWGEGWVWAVNRASEGLVRVSLGGGPPTTFNAGPGPVAVTFNQGVWTAHSTGHVTRFDPRASVLEVNTDIFVAPELDAIRALESDPAVWAISKQARSLYRISTAMGAAVTGTVTFNSPPVALGVATRSIWVATQDGHLIQISL